jgi:hypothetical protein
MDYFEYINKMRQTPHICDYEYMVDTHEGKGMFFEVCKLCLDTRGTIEI